MICKKRIFGALLVFLALTTVFLVGCSLFTKPKEGQVATPTFYPSGGEYVSEQTVTIYCSTDGATIRYTTDGTEPTESSTEYTDPIRVDVSSTIKAKGFKDKWKSSATASATYTITLSEKVATPVFVLPGSYYLAPQSVEISCETDGAVIRFTTDGTEPIESSTEYTDPIRVVCATTIKAKGFKEGFAPSATANSSYTIAAGNPAEMVFVHYGSFTMGRTKGTGENNELPTHLVTLDAFFMGKYETTQKEWEWIMGYNPATEQGGMGDNHPIYSVNWYSALKYCNLRSMNEGLTPVYSVAGTTDPAHWGDSPISTQPYPDYWDHAVCNWSANGYRLPTEAEWEYAARGASNDPDYLYAGSDDIYAVAWHNHNNTPPGTKPVGLKDPNGLGIYDMSGNVWEWCWDWFDDDYYNSSPTINPTGAAWGSYRSVRSSSFTTQERFCRVAYRNRWYPTYRVSSLGFRICKKSFR